MIENISPRRKRQRRRQLSTKPDSRSIRWREHYQHQYPVFMSSRADGTPRQVAFGRWVASQLEFLKEVRGLSMRAACKLAGVSHTQVYSWMGQPESKGYVDASPAAVRKFCTALRLDYNEAARLLGWVQPEAAPAPRDLEGFIHRARALADHPKTSDERRRVLEARIAAAESTLRAAQEMEKSAEALLKEALEDPEDANDR